MRDFYFVPVVNDDQRDSSNYYIEELRYNNNENTDNGELKKNMLCFFPSQRCKGIRSPKIKN